MRSSILLSVAALVLIPTALFAQDDSRDHRAVELTLFGGYQYGGTIRGGQTSLFENDVDIASSGSYGVLLDAPLAGNWLKFELLGDRQSTHFESTDHSLFGSASNLGGLRVSYYQAGFLVPFKHPVRGSGVTPFVAVDFGVATLDPTIAGAESSNRFAASAAFGVNIPFNRNIGLRIEERGFYANTDSGHCDGCSRDDRHNRNDNLSQAATNVGLAIDF